MFCDLIGSTALSARVDAEDLQEVIRGYQACVATTIQQAALHRQPEGWLRDDDARPRVLHWERGWRGLPRYSQMR